MWSLSALVELVRNVLGVFIDALVFFRLTLRSPSALAAENLFLRKQLGLYVERQKKPVLRQYSLVGKTDWKQSVIREVPCSGLDLVFMFTLGAGGLSFECRNLPTHLRVLPLQRLSRHEQNPDQVPDQAKEVRNRLKHRRNCPRKSNSVRPTTMPPGVRNDGEDHRPVESEQFAPTGWVEFHATSASPYLRIDAFEIHGNSESSLSKCRADVCR